MNIKCHDNVWINKIILHYSNLLIEIENDGDNLHGGAEQIVQNLRIIDKIMELVDLIIIRMNLLIQADLLIYMNLILADQDKVNISEGKITEKKKYFVNYSDSISTDFRNIE